MVRQANILLNSIVGTDGNGRAISVHSQHDRDIISSSRYTLYLRYRGLLPNSSHCLLDFAVHLSMSTRPTSLADMSVSAFVSAKTAPLCSIETMADVRSLSRFSTLSRMCLTSAILSLSSDSVWSDNGFVVSCELRFIGKQNVLPLPDFVSDSFVVFEKLWVDGGRFC